MPIVISTVPAQVSAISTEISGAAGIPTFPSAVAAANGVSLAEVVRYISEKQSPVIVTKASAVLPQSVDGTLFTVTGGQIELIALVGEVTVVIETQANDTKIKFNPAGTGGDVDLCGDLDITADAVGTLYTITGNPNDVLQDGLWVAPSLSIPIVLGPGVIELECDASNTGETGWQLAYRVLEAGATVA